MNRASKAGVIQQSVAGDVLPQLTVKAVILGIILAMVMAAANAYLGLFAGMTVSASIPASVISMGILRFFRHSNIMENNIVQTGASAGESLAAGVIFTLPALILMHHWNYFHYGWVVGIAGLGGLLGVLFTIPLRRSLVVDQELAFPEGAATAEVLKVGENPKEGLKALASAALLGALVKFCTTGAQLFPGVAAAAGYLGHRAVGYIGLHISPALLGVGYIVGLNIASLVFLGGALSWFIAIPIFSAYFLNTDPQLATLAANHPAAAILANEIWSAQIRYLGVGAMLAGGIWALIALRASLFAGIKSGLEQYRGDCEMIANLPETEKDVPMKWVLIAIVAFVVPIFFLFQNITGTLSVSLPMTGIMVVTAFLFSSVGGYMAGIVGSSNNPISGVTIATILFAALVLLWLMGAQSAIGPAAAILIGGVVCSAAAIAGDNLQDLKAGHLIGATAWKLQVMQGVGVVSAVLVMAPILNLLLHAYGFGAPSAAHPQALPAPQATLMAAVASGVFGAGLPWTMVGIGAAVGIAIILLDEWLRHRNASWRAPVLAVAVGIYLPLELSTPIFVGGLIAYFARHHNERRQGVEQVENRMRRGMLFAAGLITGEALLGITLAVPIVIAHDANVVAVPEAIRQGGWLGLIVIALVTVALARVATGTAAAR